MELATRYNLSCEFLNTGTGHGMTSVVHDFSGAILVVGARRIVHKKYCRELVYGRLAEDALRNIIK